jgi:Neurotransmitter-gated ion-channel ligand binding domain
MRGIKFCIIFVVLFYSSLPAFAQKPLKELGVGLEVNDVTKVYTQEEIIEFNATLHLMWQGDYKPNETQYFQDSQVDRFFADKWQPNLRIEEARSPWKSGAKSVKITPNGNVYSVERFNVQVETHLNIQKFPFDKQQLQFIFSEFGFSPYKLKLSMLKHVTLMDKTAHLEAWDVTGASQKIIRSPEGSRYFFTVNYQRKSMAYIYKIIFPLMIITLISFSVLWLTKEPVINRLAVVITAILTTVAFQWIVLRSTPTVSYVTYLQSILILTFVTIGLIGIILVVGVNLKTQEANLHLVKKSRIILPLVLVLGSILITLWYFL